MNRRGLAIALGVAVLVGAIFAVYPQLDIAISAAFFDPAIHFFTLTYAPWSEHVRDAARGLITLLVAPAFLAIAGKLILPRRRMLIPGRAALLLITTLALGPGILANVVLKDHWGRPRPADIVAFGGPNRFTPWWDPRGACPNNCSFVAGEPSGAFWTFAPAALAPAPWRLAAYGGVLAFGGGIGALRILGGGHFFTDVVFAGVLMFLLTWLTHGLLYRWRPTRIPDEAIEGRLARAGEALRRPFGLLTRRAGKGASRPPEAAP